MISILTKINVMMASIVIILAFSLIAYTFIYNFRTWVARTFALLLFCVMCTYIGDIALTRVEDVLSTAQWLRFQWLGIALLPVAYYLFSLTVLQTTNYHLDKRRWVAAIAIILSTLSAAMALWTNQLVGGIESQATLDYLQPGPYFIFFAAYFAISLILSLRNIWKAYQRCLTDHSRQRMIYLLIGFVAPGLGVFPYMIGISPLTLNQPSSGLVLLISLVGNISVAFMLVLMSYTVAYFGVLTPDRVVRYRMLRFFTRGPAVAILVILAMQTVPTVEKVLGLPRDIILFSVVTGVIIASQLILSVTKPIVDRVIYREDREEIAWLQELDRRLLTTSDLRQFLENNVIALCELLRVSSGFVAAVAGPELILEVVVGSDASRKQITEVSNWLDALNHALQKQPSQIIAPNANGLEIDNPVHKASIEPILHENFLVWPLAETSNANGSLHPLGIFGISLHAQGELADTLVAESPTSSKPKHYFALNDPEKHVVQEFLHRITRALADRKLQQGVFVTLRNIIPDIDQIQQLRGRVPYIAEESKESLSTALLNPSPIHSPEFTSWVKDALSHYWGGPKLTRSPLVQLRVVNQTLEKADDDPTRALRLVLGSAIERMRPDGEQNLSTPEWLLYNILEMRFIQGHKIREIATRLAISESDLYRKQRVAIDQVAKVLTEMEQSDNLIESQ